MPSNPHPQATIRRLVTFRVRRRLARGALPVLLTCWLLSSLSALAATGEFSTGCYTGNGLSGRVVTTPWQPTMVWVKRSTAVSSPGFYNFDVSGTQSYNMTVNALPGGAAINNYTASGFIVGNSASTNASGAPYCWYAWRAGDQNASRRWIDLMLADAQTPTSIRTRAEMLMALTGGRAKG